MAIELPHNRDIGSQINFLLELILRNPIVKAILERTPSLELPDWYLGAGCLVQTVWNAAHGFDLTNQIKDYDLVYFDAQDLSYEGENERIERADAIFRDLGAVVEVRNEARVHLWYEQHFGKRIAPYQSVEEAIASWPATAASMGVRSEAGGIKIFAPFGLNDLMGLIVRPNKTQVSEEVYTSKAARWAGAWPKLRVIPWRE